MIVDTFTYAFDGLKRRQLRSWLTIIGIIIAVMAIVLLVSLGQGIEVAIKDQLSFFGDDIISVAPGTSADILSSFVPSGSLTEKDVKALQNLGSVKKVTYSIEEQGTVEFKSESAIMYVIGMNQELFEIFDTYEIEVGRNIKNGERGVAIVGYKFANDFWGTSKKREKIRLGGRVVIENRSFTVVGILKSQEGGLMSTADTVVFIPNEDARDILPIAIGNDEIQEMHVQLNEGVDPRVAEKEIKETLDRLHKIKNEDERDYQVITSEQIMQYVGAITGILTLFLLGAAGISLVVGSVGVANTMFMSVLERTREIGVLKAIGASDSTIRNIFLIESGMIGAVGGIIGVILSYMVEFILSAIARYAGFPLPLDITLDLVLGSILFAFFVGMVSGYFPARRAAKLQVVDALRYE
ncbi:MAG: ABC transporter permease [Candidatus Micrarchaeota archaeon]